MKVVGICGSARKDGNTSLIIKAIFSELEREGIETELIQLWDKEISGCQGCFACAGKIECVLGGDFFNPCFAKMLAAQGIILGSPVYSADISSRMKALLERDAVIAARNPHLLKHKIGASVAALRRAGGMIAVDAMNHFFLNKEVIVVGSTYWNMVYGQDVGQVLNDSEGMANMKNIGQNMAWLLKKIHA